MIEVVPILIPQIDWPSYDAACLNVLGKSPLQGISKPGVKLKELGSYKAFLDSLEKLADLKWLEWDMFYSHIHITLLIVSDDRRNIDPFWSNCDGSLTRGKDSTSLVITQNLMQWRENIDDNYERSPEIYKKIVTIFDSIGLDFLFEGLRSKFI